MTTKTAAFALALARLAATGSAAELRVTAAGVRYAARDATDAESPERGALDGIAAQLEHLADWRDALRVVA